MDLIIKTIHREYDDEKLQAVIDEIERKDHCTLISIAPIPQPNDWQWTAYIAAFRRTPT
jgi:hypothetical protein